MASTVKLLLFINLFFVFNSNLLKAEHPLKKERRVILEIEDLFKNKEFRQAWFLLKDGLKKYPESLMFNYWSGRVLLFLEESSETQRNKNYKLAIQHLNRTIKFFKLYYEENPRIKIKYLDAIFYTGLGHWQIGNRKLAISFLKRVTAIDDKKAEAWYNMGVIYESLHNLVEANRAYGRYIKIITQKEEEF